MLTELQTFFTAGKRVNFTTKTMQQFSLHHRYVAALPLWFLRYVHFDLPFTNSPHIAIVTVTLDVAYQSNDSNLNVCCCKRVCTARWRHHQSRLSTTVPSCSPYQAAASRIHNPHSTLDVRPIVQGLSSLYFTQTLWHSPTHCRLSLISRATVLCFRTFIIC